MLDTRASFLPRYRHVPNPQIFRPLRRVASLVVFEPQVCESPGDLRVLARLSPKLLHEARHARGLALANDAPDPPDIARPRPGPALAAHDHPLEFREPEFLVSNIRVAPGHPERLKGYEQINVPNQRLQAQEPHRRRALQEVRDAQVRRGLVLAARAQPDVG